ncbi:MAG TPA: GAF domain-containing protein [Chloroflexia bacterium]|nr:GAF domain-containing protein [Chloroflexia bacterium]
MTGDIQNSLLDFETKVVGLLDLDQLLEYSIDYLHSYFEDQFNTPVNLKLGFFEEFVIQERTVRQLRFLPESCISSFASAVPGWESPFVELEESSLPGFSYVRKQAACLTEEGKITIFPTSNAIYTHHFALPLFNSTSNLTEVEATLEVEIANPVLLEPNPNMQRLLHFFGVALTNARRYAQSERRNRQLRAIGANTFDFISSPDLPYILELIVRRAMSLLKTNSAAFYMVDAARQEVECTVEVGANQAFAGIRLKFGEGVAGLVATTGKPVIVEDYNRWPHRAAVFSNSNEYHAVLGVPVFWKDEIIGTIGVVNHTPGRLFSAEDVDILSLFAAQAAAAIANSRLLDSTLRSKRELETLYSAAALVNTNLELHALCIAFVNVLQTKFGYRYVFIYIKDDDDKLQLKAQYGYERVLETLGENRGVTGRAIKTGQTQLVQNVLIDPDYLNFDDRVRSGLYVPVREGVEIVGLIGVESANSQLTDADKRMLETLGSNLGIAIKNARLFEKVASQAEQLRIRNEELEAVIAGLNEGLMIIRKAGGDYQIQLNPEGQRLLGWSNASPSQSDLRDNSNYKIYFPVYNSKVSSRASIIPNAGNIVAARERPMYRVMKGERFSDYELLVEGPDGIQRYLSYSGAPLYDEQGQVIQGVLVFHDVSALREAEQMKDSFLSLVSHDLRAPLATITGYADQALISFEEPNTPDKAIAFRSLEVIKRHSERLTRLVTDLLDMARLESGRLQMEIQPFNMILLISEMSYHLSETLPELAGMSPDPEKPERPYLRLELDRSLPYVLLDQQRFEQVFTNLLSNAVKYSNKGGEILVKAGLDPNNPGLARLTVSDHGIGIPPEKIPQLFDRFFRSEQARKGGYIGTGLGLYICRLMVEAMNGQIWANSEGPDQGTTFHVTLPLATVS